MAATRRTRQPSGRSSIYTGADGYWHGRVTVGVRDDGAPDRRHVMGKMVDRDAVCRQRRGLDVTRGDVFQPMNEPALDGPPRAHDGDRSPLPELFESSNFLDHPGFGLGAGGRMPLSIPRRGQWVDREHLIAGRPQCRDPWTTVGLDSDHHLGSLIIGQLQPG